MEFKIYDLLNSNAIREHCKSIEYKFTSLEVACIVYLANNKTINERHNAWRQIIETMPDTPMESRFGMPGKSVHEFLSEYMAIEDRLVKRFYCDDDECIYFFRIIYSDDENDDAPDTFYNNINACLEAVKEEVEEYGIPQRICVEKHTVLSAKNDSGCMVEASFSPTCELLSIEANYGLLTADENKIYNAFENMWIKIPTPFKKWDIVYINSRLGEGPFILDAIDYWEDTDDDRKRVERHRQSGDITDMVAFGYFLDYENKCRYDCMEGLYTNMEYYDIDDTKRRRLISLRDELRDNEV